MNEDTPKKLGEWHATAICGNDITSSCLYVSALALLWAGPWAPISLLLVAAVLWLFRGIYSEVVGALPLNGGAYNALLNTTSKYRASLAACLTILSYLATAVISAHEAVHYGFGASHTLGLDKFSYEAIFWTTVALLAVFAWLTIQGIGESAKVALAIFIFHMSTLAVLVILGAVFLMFNGTDVLAANWNISAPNPSDYPILIGFGVAMLGISGFESSANFVEEQKTGVFPKTLRNMWIAVSFFNPVICLLALSLIPLADVEGNKNALLAHMGYIVGGDTFGPVLSVVISINAALVLSGAVLTSFVGVTGLVHRMTLDRCLPQLLLKTGKRRTLYRVIITFFILSSMLLYVAGDVENLAGVYTLSFLSVMLLFTVGNGLLKIYRDRLPRETKVSWITVIFAALAVVAGIIANVMREPEFVKIFALYFIPTMFVVWVMLERTTFLKVGIYLVRALTAKVFHAALRFTSVMEDKLNLINSQQMVFFTRGDNIANLNQAVLYVRDNEQTNRMKIVTVIKNSKEVPESLPQDVEFLDNAYPLVDIELVIEEGEFTPELLEKLSEKWNIPLNFMFIGSPGDHFPHRLAELGGARLII